MWKVLSLLGIYLHFFQGLLGQGTYQIYQNASILAAADTLEQRLSRLERKKIVLPQVFINPNLSTNARFENHTIYLGPLQRDFHTVGDTLSLIYHEYLHKVFWEAQRFPFQFDSTGTPVQWDTGTFYTYIPPKAQTDRDLENLRFYYQREEPELMGAALEARLEKMKQVLSQPQQIPFVYAPSNLTLEEIEAYKGQLQGEKLGLYSLSPTAKKSIEFRLYQLKQTYELRRAYEEENGLGRDGGSVNGE
ncbi:MAG: hypothetical protein AAF694_00170 [Bacteroidota bacterium]